MSEYESYRANARYSDLEQSRWSFLQRARECSLLTIPALYPPQGFTSTTPLYSPYQSLGARGVNNLASKLLLTLLPPNDPFFKLVMGEGLEKDIANQPDPKIKALADASLVKMETSIITEIETRSTRVYLYEVNKQLLVGGNALLHYPAKGNPKVFSLSQYVVKRDTEGDVMEIVVREKIAIDELPAEVAGQIDEKELSNTRLDNKDVGEEECELYTWIRKGKEEDNERPDANKFYVHQEVCGVVLPKSRGEYPADKLPWVPLRMIRVSGEDYGRSYCEEYIGDLKSLEGLSQSIVDGAAAASRILLMVKPNGMTRIADVSEADNGAVIPGIAEEVTVLSLEKFNDFRVVSTEVDRLEKRLSQAFLLNSSIQRNAERVTAEEIRYLAGELEAALGGVYSLLSIELQLPLVKIVMAQMQRTGRLPTLKKSQVVPTIITGVDALGRTQQQMRLDETLATASQILGPQVVAQYVNPSEYMTRAFAARGVEAKGLVRSDQEVQAQQQQLQQQAMMQKVAPAGIKAMSDQASNIRDNAAAQQPAGG